jgi:hypothetical protein
LDLPLEIRIFWSQKHGFPERKPLLFLNEYTEGAASA